MMREFDRVTRVFAPLRMDTLKPEVLPYVGRFMEWWAMWIIEVDDNSDYAGQWAMGLTGAACYDAPFSWTPEEDLEPVCYG